MKSSKILSPVSDTKTRGWVRECFAQENWLEIKNFSLTLLKTKCVLSLILLTANCGSPDSMPKGAGMPGGGARGADASDVGEDGAADQPAAMKVAFPKGLLLKTCDFGKMCMTVYKGKVVGENSVDSMLTCSVSTSSENTVGTQVKIPPGVVWDAQNTQVIPEYALNINYALSSPTSDRVLKLHCTRFTKIADAATAFGGLATFM